MLKKSQHATQTFSYEEQSWLSAVQEQEDQV
jgi:hypothetical protein